MSAHAAGLRRQPWTTAGTVLKQPCTLAKPPTTKSQKIRQVSARERGGATSMPDLSLESIAGAAGGAITKLQRYVRPPPTGFPPGPSGDQSVAMLQGPLEFITRLRRDYGPIVGLLLGGERVVLVSDPAAARQILIDRPDVFVKAGTAFFPGSSLTGNGLLVSDGDVWKRQRRMTNPAFRKAAVDKYAEEMVAATQQLLDGPFAAAGAGSNGSRAAAAAGGRDVYADFSQLTLNITLAALFGIKAGPTAGADSPTAARIVAAVEKAFTYFAARGATAMVVPEWVPTPDNVAFREAVQQLDDLVYGIIDDRKALMAEEQQQREQEHSQATAQARSHNRSDLLQALLDSTDESGQPMSRSALRDELMTLLVAGQETSAILLGWAAALLAHNPKVQAAAAAEVQRVLDQQVLGSHPVTLGPGIISQLPHVTAVVLEALRLYSPAYMVGRCACKDIDLVGGYHLPAGSTVLVSPYLMHREPSRWKQPGIFRPDRWLPLLTGSLQQQQQQPLEQQDSSGVTKAAARAAGVADHVYTTDSSSSSSSSDSSSSESSCDSDSLSLNGDSRCSSSDSDSDSSDSSQGKTSLVNHTSSNNGNNSSSSSSGGYSFMSILRDLGPNGAYMPFGGGPRNCIGTGFAMMEAILVLAMLLQRYELQAVSPAAGFPRPKPMLTLRPEGVQLRVVRRL